jgi:hypothetical protein
MEVARTFNVTKPFLGGVECGQTDVHNCYGQFIITLTIVVLMEFWITISGPLCMSLPLN